MDGSADDQVNPQYVQPGQPVNVQAQPPQHKRDTDAAGLF